MTIEQRQHNVKLIADEGKCLTQKGEVENRLFVSSVYTKTSNLWEEWTNAQADEWIALHPQEEGWFEEIDGIEPLEMGVV